MSAQQERALRLEYADLVGRANTMQACGYYASARRLFERSWAVEARLNAAGVWL